MYVFMTWVAKRTWDLFPFWLELEPILFSTMEQCLVIWLVGSEPLILAYWTNLCNPGVVLMTIVALLLHVA
jgi:hypothetical protein